MLSFIKKYLPEFIKKKILYFKLSCFDNLVKVYLYHKVTNSHNELIKKIKYKNKIRVVFLVIHKSVWKVDSVFRRMLQDPYFDPVILVCPDTKHNENGRESIKGVEEVFHYFKNLGYPVISSFNKKVKSWVKLEELNIDVVFFTNPHNLTQSEYYSSAYKKYLSCYVPYYFMATNHDGEISQLLNSEMKQLMWRIYWPHQYIYNESKRFSLNKGRNGLVTGYPAVEVFFDDRDLDGGSWKKQEILKKKIIYSPHHSIENDNKSLSTFLSMGDLMVDIAKENKCQVQWVFKPHPFLKEKLYSHPEWGKRRADNYFEFWECQSYTQLEEGEYEQLFMESDAIIHDCSSFIVEYAFTKKPALYLFKDDHVKELLNDFGQRFFCIQRLARTKADVKEFVSQIIEGCWELDEDEYRFFESYLIEYYSNKLPSEKIVENIKSSLRHYHE